MNRRNFTKTSFFLSAPVFVLPIGSSFSQLYTKVSLQTLPRPIKAHLSEFELQMTQEIKRLSLDTKVARRALVPKTILTTDYKNAANYEFSFLNQERNKITLKAKAGRKQVIFT